VCLKCGAAKCMNMMAVKQLSIFAVQSALLVFHSVPFHVHNEDSNKPSISHTVFMTSSKHRKIFQSHCAVS
jgi:hypothetical protein